MVCIGECAQQVYLEAVEKPGPQTGQGEAVDRPGPEPDAEEQRRYHLAEQQGQDNSQQGRGDGYPGAGDCGCGRGGLLGQRGSAEDQAKYQSGDQGAVGEGGGFDDFSLR